jgi:hypothetical protein
VQLLLLQLLQEVLHVIAKGMLPCRTQIARSSIANPPSTAAQCYIVAGWAHVIMFLNVNQIQQTRHCAAQELVDFMLHRLK